MIHGDTKQLARIEPIGHQISGDHRHGASRGARRMGLRAGALTPQTNGTAERFIKTRLEEWADLIADQKTSEEPTAGDPAI